MDIIRRNACKPERGIETGGLLLLRYYHAVGTLVSPNEGLKQLDIEMSNALTMMVGTLVSPNEGLKRDIVTKPSAGGAFRRNACKPERGIET